MRERFGGAGPTVWAAVRVPDVATGRLREVDFVLAHGSKVVAVELKQWIGRVERRDGRLVQRRVGGDVVDHGRLEARLDARLESLRGHLKEACEGERCDVQSVLLFGHPEVDIADDLEMPRHAIRVAADPVADAGIGSADGGALASAVEGVVDEVFGEDLDDPPGSSETGEAVVDALDELGTWDRLDLYGGRTLVGDVEWVVEPDHDLSGRGRIERIEFDVARAWSDAFGGDPDAEAVAHLRDGEIREFGAVELDDAVCFQVVGERHPFEVDVRHAEELRFGSEERRDESLGWTDLETGKRHLGRVTGVVEFGVFVDIGGPTDGLVHISNVDRRGHTRAEELPKRFSEGQLVDVRLTGIDRSAGELDLVMIHQNPSV